MNKQSCVKLLLDCLSNRADKVTGIRMDRLLISDWNSLIRESVRYDVAPLLYSRLKKYSRIVTIPGTILQQLEQIYFHTAAKNVLLYNDLSAVCSALGNEGIEVIALKGAHLACAVYDDIGLRPASDLDILVKRRNLRRVEEILFRMGYGPAERPGIEEQCTVHHHLIPFTKQGKTPIEVHWTISPANSPFKIDLDGLWERAKRTALGGQPVLLLSPEDLLIHLCLHASFNHKFDNFEIKNICDISEIILSYGNGIDWDKLVTITENCRINKYVYSTLSLTESLLGTKMPVSMRSLFTHDHADTQMIETLKDYILLRSSFEEPGKLKKLREAKKFRDKMSVVREGLFPSLAALTKRYSLSVKSKKLPWYYIAYLFMVLMKGCVWITHATLKTETAISFLERERKRSVIEKWLVS